MHANVQTRFNPATGDMAPYYRIKEPYHDVQGRIHSLILLNIGFEPSLAAVQARKIVYVLTEHFKTRSTPSLFKERLEGPAPIEQVKTDEWWSHVEREGGIDRFSKEEQKSLRKYRSYIDFETTSYTDVRNIGAEWLYKWTIDKLQLEGFLCKNGRTENAIHTASSALIVRTVYAVSEHSSYHYLRDNSVAGGPYSGISGWTPGTGSLYKITDRLYKLKEQLKRHLCSVTDDIFNMDNKLMLFDLANSYFEGNKRNSDKARFGHSEEKCSDCRLLVLILCINQEGFMRYSSILEGNTADPKSLPNMISTLAKRNPPRTKDMLVAMGAGTVTEENLELIKKKGYNYLRVSRMKMKDYTPSDDNKNVTMMGAHRWKIALKEVETEDNEGHYLGITSPSKAMAESPMNRAWKEHFEMKLQRINDEISKKGGAKTYERAVERAGCAIQKYPSIAKSYQVSCIKNEKILKEILRVDWEIKDLSAVESDRGVYLLRSSVRALSERVTWEYYNLIREIECTNRQLKNGLNLRPIYHQRDERSDAYPFFGLLVYQAVNTICCQLKREGEFCCWTEMVRRISTQKLIITKGENPLDETIEMRQCSNPSRQAEQVYDKLNLKHLPLKKNKICRAQSP